MRARAEQLELSREALDELSGLSNGHSSKVLCDPPMKRLGFDYVPLHLTALGLKLVVAEDQDALERYSGRRARRNGNLARTAPLAPSPAERAGELRRRQCRRAGKITAARRSQPSGSSWRGVAVMPGPRR
jgi:hypothetical protein